MKFNEWLDTLVSEKGTDLEHVITVEGKSGTNWIPLQTVIEHIKNQSTENKKKVKDTLVRIDFNNWPIEHFFKHIAQSMAI